MNTRSLCLILMAGLIIPCHAIQYLPEPANNLNDDPLFNTTHLLNYPGVSRHLQDHYAAEPVTFKTDDDFNLHGLWVPGENATFTTIAATGFYPGRKEGMASFRKLLPEGNLLLFDARGHANSDGRCAYLWRNLPWYGIDEYRDVVAAMEYARQRTGQPLCMLGMCAGGFHTVRALTQLKAQGKLDQYKVQCVVLDSTFTSCASVIPAGYYHFREKLIPLLLRSIYKNDTNKEIKERYLYSLLWHCIGRPIINILTWFGSAGIQRHDPETRLCNDIHTIREIPIMFIHAKEDGYIPESDVVKLKEQHYSYPNSKYVRVCDVVNDKDELHVFTYSDHTINHLKHKNDYQEKLHAFLKRVGLIIHNMSV